MSSLSLGMLYEYLFLFVGMTLLYLVGVGYRYKFVVQVVSALLLVLSGSWIDSLVGVPVTVFAVVYVTNAINLIDGIDGLASGLCCIALSVLSVVFFIQRKSKSMCASYPWRERAQYLVGDREVCAGGRVDGGNLP